MKADTPVDLAGGMDTGARLRQVRELNGLSQRELARRAGVPNSSVSMIEQGRVSPSVDTLVRLLDALPMSLAHFFSEPLQRPDYQLFDVTGCPAQEFWVEYELAGSGQSPLQSLYQNYPPGFDSGLQQNRPGLLWSALVMVGQLEVTLDRNVKTLAAGQGFQLNSACHFRMRNIARDPVQLFVTRTRINP